MLKRHKEIIIFTVFVLVTSLIMYAKDYNSYTVTDKEIYKVLSEREDTIIETEYVITVINSKGNIEKFTIDQDSYNDTRLGDKIKEEI